MRGTIAGLIVLAAGAPQTVWAGDKVLIRPVPDWTTPAPPLDFKTMPRAGNSLPLFDEQVRVDGDVVTAFFDSATVISSPEVLTQRGTLSINWRPSHGDLTFHRLEILRDGETVDALGDGGDITVLRREAGLERLVVDGQLTAVKHIEGLRVGDVLHAVFSVSSRDGVLGGQVQDGMLLIPGPARIGFGRARLVWPSDRAITWKALMPGIAATPRALNAQWTELVVPLPLPKLAEMPKNMPSRFAPVPLIQFTSFAGWDDVARVMAPLYTVKGAIAPGSDLAARVDAIAARSPDPVRRMADALQMVQDEVRYQLVALGTGNYVPQAPADTWSKRYGDCKAKTVLLLAMLDRLGIAAEPVLANIKRGDAVSQMLPAALAFDHVFVRARSGGEEYWLDGTMLGSRHADIRDVPRYGQVLPLGGSGAGLLDLPRRAHARPDIAIDVAYDMSAGPHLPAPFRLTLRYAGPYAAANKVENGADYDEKLTGVAEKAAKNWVGSETIDKPTAQYDAKESVWTLAVEGVGYPDWQYRDRRYGLAVRPTLNVMFDAPRDRAAWRTIPALIDQPWTAQSHVVIDLPDAGRGATITGVDPAAVDLPAVVWRRTFAPPLGTTTPGTTTPGRLVEDIISRESGIEITPDKVSAVTRSLADASARTAHVELDPAYPQRWDDVARKRASPAMIRVRALFDRRVAARPDDAGRLTDRAWLAERLFDWVGAETYYARAIAVDASAARYLSRAKLRALRSDHPGALKDAQAAYDLEQGNAEARNQLAAELAEAGQVDESLALLPNDPDVTTENGLSDFLQRVYVLEVGNRHDEALELLDRALEKRGSSAELRNSRCWYQALRNANLDIALSDCNRAIELASNPAGYLDSRALVHFRRGDFAEARKDYDAALATAPDQPSSLFMSAVVSGRLGEKAKAAEDQRAARVLYPDIVHFYQRFGIAP
jgi:tetratricopeptide (TPR) repeat protein